MELNNVISIEKENLRYIQFSNIIKYENFVKHCFTTRLGGVSTGECSSLNLGFNRNDDRQNVLENYKIIAAAIGVNPENMVLSRQVHDIRIKEVGVDDQGKGIFKDNDLFGYDGLMTNKKNVALVTFYADCVPVFFIDPNKKAIAISHSGWRGTVKEIAAETIKSMKNAYGSRPEDIETAIGPSIGQCCFEVGGEVYEEFKSKLPWSAKFCRKTKEDKWNIGLQQIIKESLMNSGVKEDNINLSGICTKCNKATFFSHRGDNGKTGSLAAIMQLY